MLLLTDEKDQVPANLRSVLPKSWSELEAEVNRNGAARRDTEFQKMHVILLVAKSPVELTSLIHKIPW